MDGLWEGRWRRLRIGCTTRRHAQLAHACMLLAATTSLVATTSLAAASSAVAGGYSYCHFNNQTFKDPRRYLGVTASDVLTGSQSYRACALGRMAHSHISYFRYDMDWAGVEWHPGVFNFSGYDALMTQLAQHHIAYLPVLMNPP